MRFIQNDLDLRAPRHRATIAEIVLRGASLQPTGEIPKMYKERIGVLLVQRQGAVAPGLVTGRILASVCNDVMVHNNGIASVPKAAAVSLSL